MANVGGDLFGQVSNYLPSLQGVQLVIFWVIIIVIVGIILGFGMWAFINSKKYSRKILIYKEEYGGKLRKIGSDKAKVMTIDKGLAKIWYLKKLKMYTQPFVYTSGKLEYPVIQKNDGDLVNFELIISSDGSTNVTGRVLPTSLRMANANIRRYLRESYKEQKFLERWGGMLLFVSAIVILSLIWMWILMEVGKIVPALQNVATTLSDALSKVHCSAVPSGGQVVNPV
jgi:hypothetical protein